MRPRGSLGSPFPLLAGGIAAALLLIALVTLPIGRASAPDASELENLNEGEAITLVAREMRSGDAAIRVSSEGQARFDQGTWLVTVGDATFHFNQRTRIVVADNDAARALMFGGPAR